MSHAIISFHVIVHVTLCCLRIILIWRVLAMHGQAFREFLWIFSEIKTSFDTKRKPSLYLWQSGFIISNQYRKLWVLYSNNWITDADKPSSSRYCSRLFPFKLSVNFMDHSSMSTSEQLGKDQDCVVCFVDRNYEFNVSVCISSLRAVVSLSIAPALIAPFSS